MVKKVRVMIIDYYVWANDNKSNYKYKVRVGVSVSDRGFQEQVLMLLNLHGMATTQTSKNHLE